jgi:hypothetical protein
MEGSLVAYKVFTNGSVLNASEVNDNLMNQAVITFSNSAARTSAITSPVEGMVTYLADTDNFWFWNGSAWTSFSTPSGLTLINRTSFSGATSVVIDSVFNTTYDTYMIVIEDVQTVIDSTHDLLFQFRYGSTTRNSSYYGTCGTLARGTTTTWTNQGAVNAASLTIVKDIGLSGAGPSAVTLFVNQVGQSSERASIRGQSFNGKDADVSVIAGVSDLPETYTGFVLSSTQNINGNVATYGLRK